MSMRVAGLVAARQTMVQGCAGFSCQEVAAIAIRPVILSNGRRIAFPSATKKLTPPKKARRAAEGQDLQAVGFAHSKTDDEKPIHAPGSVG